MQKDQRNTVRQFFSFQKFFFFLCCIIKFVKRREYCEAWVYYLKTKKWILHIVIFGRLIFFLNEFLCNARNFRYFFFFLILKICSKNYASKRNYCIYAFTVQVSLSLSAWMISNVCWKITIWTICFSRI